MSLTFGFYNSVNHDRTYDALQVSSIFDGIIEDGVYASIGDKLTVSARSVDQASMTVIVGTGRAWFNHTWTLNDALLPLTLDVSDQVLDRIDAVVLEIDSNNRTNAIKIKKGTPSSAPIRPSMSPEDGKYYYPLAYIKIRANVTAITQADITNAVGTSECPFVTGVLETVDIDNLLTQWTSQAEQLIAEIRRQAEQAAAGSLIDGSVTYSKLASDAVRIRWNDVNVPDILWTEDPDGPYSEQGYSYRAIVVPATNASLITSTMQPDVVFSPKDLASGVLAPFANTIDGGICIYATDKPDSMITISTLTCWR